MHKVWKVYSASKDRIIHSFQESKPNKTDCGPAGLRYNKNLFNQVHDDRMKNESSRALNH